MLSEKEKEIGLSLTHVNQLTSFPFNVEQLADWALTINELKPDLKIEKLKEAIDKMKLGKVEFNQSLGIQNIFIALDSLERPMVY